MATRVTEIFSDRNFREEFEKTATNQLLVVDFSATWCGPCRFIAPKLAELSLKYISVKFLKVDVDICQTTAASHGIQAMPTFLFFKNKQKVETLKGADPQKLEQAVLKWMGSYSVLETDPQRVVLGRSFPCFEELIRNPREVFEDTAKLILRYANNILKDPDNLRYRQIKLSNAVFMNKLLPTEGAVNCFFTMGFEEMDDKLLLPPSSSLNNLHILRDALTAEMNNKTNKTPQNVQTTNVTRGSVACGTTSGTLPNFNKSTTQVMKTLSYNAVTTTNQQKTFFETFRSHTNTVLMYEDKDLQKLAHSKIPVEKLKEQAGKNSEKTKNKDGVTAVSLNDCLLLLLLEWFKNEFFTWTDAPECPNCAGETNHAGLTEPTEEDRRWSCTVVELYMCRKCSSSIRFPRYNHPQKLLETRTGRCGEWANCFTLCCRAVGLEARYILDWTDHVWTEVYSEGQQRWLHCDACENTCDKPLVYETGWGKELSYVIAFSKDEVIDVTWRYSSKHLEVKSRRNLVTENWLIGVCEKITDELRSDYSVDDKKKFLSRHIKEIVEFVTPKTSTNEGELGGRQSGSLAWRQIRGETGPQKENQSKSSEYTFTLSKLHIEAQRFRLRYNPAKDSYYASLSDDLSGVEPVLSGWQNGVYTYENIKRKVEKDWKMVYLARTEGSEKAKMTWVVNLQNSGYCCDHVTIYCFGETFENGVVKWQLNSEAVTAENELKYSGSDFSSKEEIRIEVTMSGGTGDNSWQHSQLFRCEESNEEFCGLDLIITLMKKTSNNNK